jgi:hypothetical protein
VRARPARVRLGLVAVALTLASLGGCSSGPSQEQRIADAITAYDTVTADAAEVDARLLDLYPDLDLTIYGGEGAPRSGNWIACSDEPYDNRYDSPDGSRWLNGNVYTLEPRQPTDQLVQPLAQTFLDDGWTLDREDLGGALPEIVLRKDGYRLVVSGVTQDHLDRTPKVGGLFTITFYSPCLYSPDNLTEWDRTDPHDFDLAPPDD